jgi:hypothetical protein
LIKAKKRGGLFRFGDNLQWKTKIFWADQFEPVFENRAGLIGPNLFSIRFAIWNVFAIL